jgi:hypothetical protein
MNFYLIQEKRVKELEKEILFSDINRTIDEFAQRLVATSKFDNPWLVQFQKIIFTKKDRVSKDFIKTINKQFNMEYLICFYRFIFNEEYKAIERFQKLINSKYKSDDVYPVIKENITLVKTKIQAEEKRENIKETKRLLLHSKEVFGKVKYEREFFSNPKYEGLMYRQRVTELSTVIAKLAAYGFYTRIEPDFEFLND